jgi:hypothetical protein
MAGNRCWNLETRPKLRRNMCSIIRQMLRLILKGRVIRERGRPPFQFQSEAPGFFKYLLEERGMKKLTVARYLRELNRLADYLKRVKVTLLSELSPQLLSSYPRRSRPDLEMAALDYYERLGHDNHRRLCRIYGWEEKKTVRPQNSMITRS